MIKLNRMTLSRVLQIIIFFQAFTLGAQGEFVVRYDLDNNSIDKVGPKVEDVMFIIPGFNSFNENEGIFYFMSSESILYGIDVSDGEVFDRIIAEDLTAIEYSNKLKTLFGIRRDQENGNKSFVRINFTSGQFETIGDPIESSSTFQGYDSFSDKDSLFTFMAPPGILYSIHAVTGKVKFSPVIDLPSTQTIQHFNYHPDTGILYSLISENGGDQVFLAKLNPQTAQIEKIGSSISNLNFGGSGAINVRDNQYLCLFRDQGGDWVGAINLDNGTVEFKERIDLDNQDNLIDIEYDNRSNSIYSKHWDALISSAQNIVENRPTVFPNPTTDLIAIKGLPLDQTEYNIQVFNSAGLCIVDAAVAEGGSLSLKGYPDGIYIFKIFDKTELLFSNQISIQK